MNAKEELETRVRKHAREIHRIEITWSASDGGSRMDVTLKGENEHVLEKWNDDMILGNTHLTGVQQILLIVGVALGQTIRIEDQGFYHITIVRPW